jgi:hypothetical protein
MFMRDALNAGRSPPAKPMKIENAMDLMIIPGAKFLVVDFVAKALFI